MQVTALDPSVLVVGDDVYPLAQVSQVEAKEQVAQLESQSWQAPAPSLYCPAEHGAVMVHIKPLVKSSLSVLVPSYPGLQLSQE